MGIWTEKEDLLSFACDTVGDRPSSVYENDTIFPMDASNEDMNVSVYFTTLELFQFLLLIRFEVLFVKLIRLYICGNDHDDKAISNSVISNLTSS